MYTLTKIKTFTGLEGQGLNATICRDGKPVAFVLDDANGGEVRIDFTNPGQNAESYKASKGNAAAEEKACLEWCLNWLNTSPDAEASRKQDAEMLKTYPDWKPTPINDWIDATVDAIATKKRLDRLAKTKTLFRVEGDSKEEYRTLKRAYDAEVQKWLDQHYPGKVIEIYGVRASA